MPLIPCMPHSSHTREPSVVDWDNRDAPQNTAFCLFCQWPSIYTTPPPSAEWTVETLDTRTIIISGVVFFNIMCNILEIMWNNTYLHLFLSCAFRAHTPVQVLCSATSAKWLVPPSLHSSLFWHSSCGMSFRLMSLTSFRERLESHLDSTRPAIPLLTLALMMWHLTASSQIALHKQQWQTKSDIIIIITLV